MLFVERVQKPKDGWVVVRPCADETDGRVITFAKTRRQAEQIALAFMQMPVDWSLPSDKLLTALMVLGLREKCADMTKPWYDWSRRDTGSERRTTGCTGTSLGEADYNCGPWTLGDRRAWIMSE